MIMGPAVGQMLADLGADVIKVEPVGGDKTKRLRGVGAGYFPMFNRNKRFICLDVKSEHGAKIARELISEAGVFIENMRPGAMDKLGFGYNELQKLNPRLVFCFEKGFLDGPYSNRAVLDEVAQMMGGCLRLRHNRRHVWRRRRSGGAARNRKTRRDKHVKAALFETTAFLVGQHMAQYAVTGTPAASMPARVSAWAIYDRFETKDG